LTVAVLRWGIIGPGRISTRIVRALASSSRGTLAAVASRDPDRAAAYASRHGVGRSFGSYDELLASSEIDVVYIALPNHLHAQWTIRALEAGKHVLCEKPLALTVEDVDAIQAAARMTGRIAVEAFMYLHHPQILRALEVAGDGLLGPLELIRGTFSFLLSTPDDPRIDPAMGGGSLWDVGCYPVSFARRLAGEEPDRVAAFARLDERGVDRTFIGQLHFPSGLLAQFDSGFRASDRESFEIVGQAGRLVLDSPFVPAPDGPRPVVTLWRGRVREQITVPSMDQYRAEVEDLTGAILDGTPPRVSLDFSRGTIATLVDLDLAARSTG
jgi:xylose dehydrogenase (NAD/NADP)